MTRTALLSPFLLAGALGLASCKEAEQRRAPVPDAERQRVLAFWQQYAAATAARIDRDCAHAVVLYERALAFNPRHEDSLYYLGQCRRELGRRESARDAFGRLLELNPASARGHLALGALLASPDAGDGLDLGAAERHFRRAHAINAEETGPMVRLGEILLVTGRRHEARGWFESALRTNPRSVEAALLVTYAVWVDGGADRTRLVQRVRDAAKSEAPTKGVLGEGDRPGTQHGRAPALTSPLGRLLFDEPILALRARASGGERLSADDVIAAWRSVERLCRTYQSGA